MIIKLWRQYAVGLAVTFNMFVMAIGAGWASPSQVRLQNAETSPLGYALTDDEFATVNSVFMPASLFGPLICGALVSVISCRHVILIALTIQLIGSILVALALNMFILMLGRIVLGFASTIISSCVLIFINEITTGETRGQVSTFISFFSSFCLLYAYSLGSFTSYYVFNSVNACIVAVHMIVMYLLPESPVYLMRKGDREGAIKVLTLLNGRKVFDLDLEFPKPKAKEPRTKWINPKIFTDKANVKSIFLASTLIGCQCLTGATIFIAYMNYIFEAAGSKLTPSVATIVVAGFTVASTIVASSIVSKVRRKVLLIPAYIIAIINTSALGIYFKLDNDGWNVRSTMGYLPLVTIILCTIMGGIAIGPVSYATIAELTTPETKTAISTFTMTTAVVLGFLILRLFGVMINAMGAHGMFFMSSGFCLLLLLIVIFILPETKDKTADEIRALLM